MKRDTIGSSDVAAILGLSPYQSAGEVWARLVGLTEESNDTPSQARGRVIEPALVDVVRERYSLEVWSGPEYDEPPIVDDQRPWAHARPDGIARAGEWWDGDQMLAYPEAIAVVEAKSRRTLDGWGPDGSDGVPLDVLVQAGWQAAIVGVRVAYVAAYGTLADDLRTYRVEFTREALDGLLARVAAWRERYVLGGEPPPATPLSALARVRQYGGAKTWRTATPDLEAVAAMRASVGREIKRLEATKARLDAELAEAIGEDYGITTSTGSPIARWSPRRGAERGPSGKAARALVAEWRAEAEHLDGNPPGSAIANDARATALRECADAIEATITKSPDGRTFAFLMTDTEGGSDDV